MKYLVLFLILLMIPKIYADDPWKAYDRLQVKYTFEEASGKVKVELSPRKSGDKVKLHARTQIAILDCFSFYVYSDRKKEPHNCAILKYSNADEMERQFHEWTASYDRGQRPLPPAPVGDIRGNDLPEIEISQEKPLVKEFFIWDLRVWDLLLNSKFPANAEAELNFTYVPMVRMQDGSPHIFNSAISFDEKKWKINSVELARLKSLLAKAKANDQEKPKVTP